MPVATTDHPLRNEQFIISIVFGCPLRSGDCAVGTKITIKRWGCWKDSSLEVHRGDAQFVRQIAVSKKLCFSRLITSQFLFDKQAG